MALGRPQAPGLRPQNTGVRFPPSRLGARVSLVVALLCATSIATATAQEPPPELTAPVNDFAGVIDAENESRLDDLIRRLQSASGDVLVVATVKTFQPAADIRIYATEMFENRGKGIGQKGKDNGLLMVLAVDDREVWAEVGYDLEAIITDGFAGETSRQVMVPRFRQGDFGSGLLSGAAVFAQRIARARNVSLDGVPVSEPVGNRDGGGFPILPLILLVLFLLNAAGRVSRALPGGRKRQRRWGSMVGPFGAGYGGWHHGGGGWSGGGGFGGGFGGFGGGRSGGGGGGASW